MTDNKTIQQAFNEAAYPVGGHGKRNFDVLLEAFRDADGETDGDTYGTGAAIERFEEEMAAFLGKPAAVFFPSGTMAQQIALRMWSDRRGSKVVAYHPLCHLEIHEQDGLRKLHLLEPVLLGERSRLITAADVAQLADDTACLLLELPQREIGGQLPSFEELETIAEDCRKRGIKLHLDGARLFEILPYYGRTAAEICALFDSVYVSFYKGIGGVAGAILAGERDFADESKIWKRRHGGDLISLYPYIVPAAHYFKARLPKMESYYRDAVELAAMYNGCGGASTRPLVPVSNMFNVHFERSREQVEPLLVAIAEQSGVGLTANLRDDPDGGCYFEISLGDRYPNVPKDKLAEAFRLLCQALLGSERRP